MKRLLVAALAAPLLLLAGCGGGGDDDASAAACRGMAAVDASLANVESSATQDGFTNEDAVPLTDAVAQVVRFVSAPSVSNDLAVPVTRLTAAYGAFARDLRVGDTAAFGKAKTADRDAWTGMVAACKPYVDLGS